MGANEIVVHFDGNPQELAAQVDAIGTTAMYVNAMASSIRGLRNELLQQPGLGDLVLAYASDALGEQLQALGELVEGGVSGALASLLGLEPGELSELDADVLGHDSSPSVGGPASARDCGCGDREPTGGDANTEGGTA